MKLATVSVIKTHTKQSEIDELKSQLYSIQNELNYLKEAQSRALQISKDGVHNAIYSLERKRDTVKLGIADALVSGYVQTKHETIEPEPLKIIGLEFKLGDRVKLDKNAISEAKDWIKGHFSPTGTIVFRGVSNIDIKERSRNSVDNYCVDVRLHVCLDVGPTIQLWPNEVTKIKPSVKPVRKAPVAIELAPMPDNVVELKPNHGFAKGDRVQVSGNEIFAAMGFEVVTGTIFVVNAKTGNLSIQCDQTRAIELVSFDCGGVVERE